MYNINNIYNNYIKEYNDTVDKNTFKKICDEFNIEIIESILEGSTFDMGNNLSTLSVRRVDRDPRTPRVDWGESIIYYTDKFYCKYYWKKGKCRIPNKSVYRFTPTRGLKGNKEKLINLLKTDDLAYLKFKK